MSSIEKAPYLILVTHEGMGKAEIELQIKLFGSYLTLLNESDYLPSVIAFYADGVKLIVESSPVLEQLKTLEERGVRLIVCSTCLNYFNLTDKVQTGIVGGMTDIIEAQWRADKVITI